MTHVHLHHKISALVDGELHGSARYRALHHIGRCDGCRQELEATLALKRRMSGLSDVEPSADLFASLDSATVAGRRSRCQRAPQGVSRASSRPVVRRVLVGAGTVTAAVLSLAYALGGPADVSANTVTPPVDEYMADFAGGTGLAPLADPAADVLAADPEPAAQVVSRGGPTMEGSGPTGSRSTEAQAERVLRRAMSAPDRFAYAGVREVDFFDAGAPTILRLSVHHAPRQGTSFQVVDRPAGTTATFIAESEAVASGGLTSEPLQQLANAYDLSVGPSASVLGRKTTVVEASRAGDIEARFWVDDATGLLLRREMYASGRVVRSSAFTRLRVSRAGFLPHLPPELEAPSSIELAKATAPLLSDYGWTCPPRLADHFVLSRLDRLDTDANVMRASYSDGLSTVSVFEQRGTLSSTGLPGLTRQTVRGTPVFMSFGLPTVAAWGSGGTVYTVVTDAPDDTARAIVASLPHAARPSLGVGERLSRGLQRLAGELEPDR